MSERGYSGVEVMVTWAVDAYVASHGDVRASMGFAHYRHHADATGAADGLCSDQRLQFLPPLLRDGGDDVDQLGSAGEAVGSGAGEGEAADVDGLALLITTNHLSDDVTTGLHHRKTIVHHRGGRHHAGPLAEKGEGERRGRREVGREKGSDNAHGDNDAALHTPNAEVRVLGAATMGSGRVMRDEREGSRVTSVDGSPVSSGCHFAQFALYETADTAPRPPIDFTLPLCILQ